MSERRGAWIGRVLWPLWSNADVSQQPGWYEDPAGSGGLRYWDGARWTEHVSVPADPHAKARAGEARQHRAGDPAGGTAPEGRTVSDRLPVSTRFMRRRVLPRVIGLGVLILVLLIVMVIRNLSGPGTGTNVVPTATPTVSGWDEGATSPTPTSSPTPTRTSACGLTDRVVAGHVNGGEAVSAGLAFDVPAGWSSVAAFSGILTDTVSVGKSVPDTSWSDLIELGRAPGAVSAEEAARDVIVCHLSSGHFPGHVDDEVLVSRQIDLDGRAAWWLQAHATSGQAPGGGAVYNAVAVDLGDGGGPSVFWTGVVDSDTAGQEQADAARASLRITG